MKKSNSDSSQYSTKTKQKRAGLIDSFEKPFIDFDFTHRRHFGVRVLAWIAFAMIIFLLELFVSFIIFDKTMISDNPLVLLIIPGIIICAGFLRSAYIESESIVEFIVFLICIPLYIFFLNFFSKNGMYEQWPGSRFGPSVLPAAIVVILFYFILLHLMKMLKLPGTNKK